MTDIKRHCSNCGAPITMEVCSYCNMRTGLDSKDAVMEYPVIDCKEANISFWNFFFPMIFAVSFGFFGFVFPIIFLLNKVEGFVEILLIFSIFAIIGVVALVIASRAVIRYLLVKIKGKEIEATVYGYIDDNFLLNGTPAQTVKLFLNTNDGPKFILYQLGDNKRLYKINSKINLLVYRNLFLILKNKYYF